MGAPSWDDLRDALAGVPAGKYRSRDLLPHYNEWARREGRGVVTAKTLGEALSRETCLERSVGHGHARKWIFQKAGLDCRNWFHDPKRDGPRPDTTAQTPPEPVR